MSGNLTSTVTNIQFLDNIGLQCNFTGSPVGLISAEVSADYEKTPEGTVSNQGSWAPIPLSYFSGSSMTTALSIPVSVGSPIYIDLNQLSAPWIRIKYTFTSGTGVLSSFITCKQV